MSRPFLSPTGIAQHLGSGRIFTVWLWVILMPFSVAILGGFDDARSDAERAVGLAVAVGVHVCIGLLMLSGAAIERGITSNELRAAAVVAYMAFLGALRPVLIDGAQRLLGVDLFAGNLGTRMATNVVFFVISITILSLLINTLRQQASARVRLRTVVAVVNANTEHDEAALAAAMQRVRSDAAKLIGLALQRERPQHWQAEAEADALRRVSEEVVRPLSHLAFDSSKTMPATATAQQLRQSPTEHRNAQSNTASASAMLNRADLAELDLRPARIWLAPLLYCLLFLPYLLSFFGVTTGLALSGAGFLAALLGNALVKRLLPLTTRTAARIAVLVGYAAVGTLIALSSYLVLLPEQWRWPILVMHVLSYPTIAVAVAACQSAVRQLRARNHALAEALAAADRRSAAAHSRLVVAREGLARLLHTSVQGELVAVSLRVRRGEADAAEIDQAVDTIQRTLTEHGTDEQGSRAQLSADAVRESAARLLGSWGSALAIESHIDDEVWGRLAHDNHLAAVALDVVSEALSNVMRHASTPEARLRVRNTVTGISIAVTSPGSLGEGSPADGYGLADLRARVSTLTLQQIGQRVVLTALVD